MISNNYEKPLMQITEFEIEDIISASSAEVITTAPFTTQPTTSSQGGVHVGGAGDADIVFDCRDYYN